MERVTYPIRVLKLLGVETLIVTNAAGGLNPESAVGDIFVLNDHIFLAGLAGVHPLRGPNMDHFGTRFPPLSDAYDLDLRRSAHRAWQKSRVSGSKRRLHEGIYAFVGGPR
jgi:purine-nucleoside phosphorylase